MVHRDVKSANCLFSDGELKLADFGLLVDADRQISRLGTQSYMPPDGRMDARADVYAAGLVIYEMLTGRPASCLPRLGDRARAIAAEPRLRVLNRLALRACQPEPQQRFADARAMLDALDAADPERAARLTRSRRWVVGWIAAAVAVLLMVAIGLWMARPPRVSVNFITYPFEATIHLDGRRLEQPGRTPYRTPCTVPNLPARPYHVVFKHDGREDLDAGRIDFAEHRQIVGSWE
jgi:serine/threonine protein kinase